ncbi:hypothetical protein [Burkholderia sp. BCC0044]|uniref:hypothetical protein n=1 Tax=Burkholderia sp. BCC0044 TaxID=2676295 RepID=UPI00158D088F|nr:hypothetical protein [Burkholderia sp. BCC0044]
MRSIFNDAFAHVDAHRLRIWTGAGASRRADGPLIDIAHEGVPALAFAAALSGLPKARNALFNRVRLQFAYPWAQAVVLPWQSGVWSDAAWCAYGRALFDVRALRIPLAIRIEPARFGRARLAVALSDDVLRGCIEASRATGWKLTGCRDVLSVALQTHRKLMRERDLQVLLRQRDVATCLFRRDGEWADIVTLPYRADQRVDDLAGAAALMSGLPLIGQTYATRVPDTAGIADSASGTTLYPLSQEGEPE